MERIEQIPIECLVYFDESGAEDNITFTHGYSLEGKRCYDKKEFRYNIRLSKIASLRNSTPFAPCFFTGYCNSSIFELICNGNG